MPCVGRRLLTAIQFLTILRSSCKRSKLILAKHFFTVADIVAVTASARTANSNEIAIDFIYHMIFEGMRLGEAAHPSPRLRRSRPVGEAAGGQPVIIRKA